MTKVQRFYQRSTEISREPRLPPSRAILDSCLVLGWKAPDAAGGPVRAAVVRGTTPADDSSAPGGRSNPGGDRGIEVIDTTALENQHPLSYLGGLAEMPRSHH